MRAAENFAGLPPPNDAYEWFSSLEVAGKMVTYWKLRLNIIQSNIYASEQLERSQLSITIYNSGLQDLEYVTLQLKTS